MQSIAKSMRWFTRGARVAAMLAVAFALMSIFQLNGALRTIDLGADRPYAWQDDLYAGALANATDEPGLEGMRSLECNGLPIGRAHDLCLEDQALEKALDQQRISAVIGSVVVAD